MKIGTYVCDIADEQCTDPAIVVYNDPDYQTTNQIKRADGHLSLRDDKELRCIEPIYFVMVWCKDQIGYDGLDKAPQDKTP